MNQTRQPYIVSYLVDADDRITAVNQSWNEFARENNGGTILAEYIIGQHLFRHISDDPTRIYLQLLLNYVRMTGKSISRDYRCDSDNEKRFMCMTISSEGRNILRLDHQLLKIEQLPRRTPFITDYSASMVRCSWCNNLRINGHWSAPDSEFSLAATNAFRNPVLYSLCQVCQNRLADRES